MSKESKSDERTAGKGHAIYTAVLLLGLNASQVWAAYTANHASTVRWVKIYNSDTIYFRLDDQPATQCPDQFFALSPTLTEKQRDRYYVMLLTARSTGAEVVVGYDGFAADCLNGRPLVHALEIRG